MSRGHDCLVERAACAVALRHPCGPPAIPEDNGKRLVLDSTRIRCLILMLLAAGTLPAGEHRGVVKLGTLPVPGAAVTARQGDRTVATLTDLQGAYVFPDLADGKWTISVEMRGFA